MSFMQHEVTHKQGWIEIDGNCGTTWVPDDDVGKRVIGCGSKVILFRKPSQPDKEVRCSQTVEARNRQEAIEKAQE